MKITQCYYKLQIIVLCHGHTFQMVTVSHGFLGFNNEQGWSHGYVICFIFKISHGILKFPCYKISMCIMHNLKMSLFVTTCTIFRASLVGQMVKNLPVIQDTQVRSLDQNIPWRRAWLPIPVFLPGEFYGQRSLLSYSPQGSKELDRLSN